MLGPDGRSVIGPDGKMVMVDANGRPIQPPSGTAGLSKDKGKANVKKRGRRKTRQVFFVPNDFRQLPESRIRGPIDYDTQCGVIKDKGNPCFRSIACKAHSKAAKRRVQGRSRNYDDLLLEWRQANKSNLWSW